jgi:hypothetical protein
MFTSMTAANVHVMKRGLKPLLLVEQEAQKDFDSKATSAEEADAVVVGLCPSSFCYDKVIIARVWLFNFLKSFSSSSTKLFTFSLRSRKHR